MEYVRAHVQIYTNTDKHTEKARKYMNRCGMMDDVQDHGHILTQDEQCEHVSQYLHRLHTDVHIQAMCTGKQFEL